MRSATEQKKTTETTKADRLRRRFAVLLALALTVTSVTPAAGAYIFAADTGSGQDTAAGDPASETVSKKTSPVIKTTIKGYPKKINKRYAQTVKIKAEITPAYGRTVRLQRYSSSKKKWKTIKKVKAGKGETSTISFTIPKKYHKKTTSVWRIYAPASDTGKSKKSKDIVLTTRNIKSISLSAGSACIYRIDGEGKGTLIYTKAPDKKRAQASTTKLMTAILLLEKGDLKGTTRISSHAASTPSDILRFTAGDVYNNKDLLFAMMLPSHNGSAMALAESVGGSEKAFVKMMNKRAKELDMDDTNFKHPHGLDASGHYSTANDVAKLTAYAYTFPDIRKCWKTRRKSVTSLGMGRTWSLKSTTRILNYSKNFLGGKTGTQNNSGYCFAGVYKYKGELYVTVNLGSKSESARWSDTKKLHKYIKKYAATKY